MNRYFYPDHSATSQMLSDLAFFLAGAGHTVSVITSAQQYDEANARLQADEVVRGVAVYRVRTTRFGRGNLLGRAADYASFYLTAGWQLWRLARAGDVIVAKTDPPLIMLAAAVIARARGARLVNWMQDVFPEVAEALGVRGVAGPPAQVLRASRNRALHHAAMNVVLGERMAAVLAREGVPAQRICVIPNWADKDAIVPLAAIGNPLRQAWGLAGKLAVCYSGNMGRAHEFDTILDAAAQMAVTAPNIRFVFIGAGAQRRRVESEVARRSLANVQFQPYQAREDLSLSLGVGDIHLVSQRPEVEGFVFPSKLYGILAAGRPLVFIGAPDGEIGRLVEREGVGVAVRQGDAAGLAEQLVRLAGDAAQREAMGRRARALLCTRYDKSIAFKAWQDLLAGLGRF